VKIHANINAKFIHQDKETIIQTFADLRHIKKGEEVMIYYNDDFEEFIQVG
jgi:hypothetical protein